MAVDVKDKVVEIVPDLTVRELAEKLEISVATVYRYLNDLKTQGAPIKYCRNRQSYYYTQPFDLKF